MSDFVLDLDSNPHPRMLEGALDARRRAEKHPTSITHGRYWQGYLDAMADATGCSHLDLIAWLDRHEGDA